MSASKKSKVYFTKTISSEKVVEMFKILNKDLPGKIAIKVHSGEKGNKNFLHPEFLRPMVDYLQGTIVECNTAYGGVRMTTESHKQLMNEHEWTKYFKVDILDGEGHDDELEIPNGFILKKTYVGKRMKNYDSCLVLSHFKGHGSGGYGGALKQLSIGFGSTAGKCLQHTGGQSTDTSEFRTKKCGAYEFKETMADAASVVVKHFKGNMAFINIMANISLDCDCDGSARPPVMADIGILSSTDPVALDQACLDLIYNSNDEGKTQLIERIESLYGPHIIECSVKLGTGIKEYELIHVK
jgi:uncharacterized Fe-S center protein